MLASVAMFISDTFFGYRLSRSRRQSLVEMGCDRGFIQSDATKDELAKLSFQTRRVAIIEAGSTRQARQRRRQHRVMGEPKQIERRTADRRRIAGRNGAFQRIRESRSD